MKKSIVALIVGCCMMFGGLNEYEEISIPDGNEYTSIVCEVKSNEEYGFFEDEYLPCENVYDVTDFPLLDRGGLEVGELMHVTFFHDDIWTMEKIEGYKLMIKKE